ncbi:MAG: MarR family transcriptional regulator, partial [Caedimonadaceae bacterium]
MILQNAIIEQRALSQSHTSSVTVHSADEQVAVIRKEFVMLTGDPFSAVILNQLMYWTQRVRDFDLLLKEECTFRPDCNVPPRHGWIYKTAHDLIEETLLGISHPTMRKYLKLLIDRGWIDERAHPIDKWNKTTQYRVNLRKLQEDLMAIGRNLPLVYLKAFPSSLLEEASPQQAESSALQSNVRNFHLNESLGDFLLPSPLESKKIPNVKILHSNVENFHSDVKNLHSNVRNLHSYTYTENTPKTTNREHAEGARANSDKSFF